MHFSTTRFIDPDHRKPGNKLLNKVVGIDPLIVYKKLKLVLLHNADTARNLAIEAYAKSQKEQSLKLLYSTTRNIERLDAEIAHMIRASDKKKDQLKKLQYQLILLGVSNEKVEIATKHKELPYMLTEEVERELIREERKQKREEEEQEVERKKRKREMIVVKDGKLISRGDTAEEVQEEGDTSHAKTLIQQQSDMMKSQEVVIHTQEAQMIELQLKIRQLEAENQKLALEKQQLQEQLQTTKQVLPTAQEDVQQFPSLSNIALPLLDPSTLELDTGVDPSTSTKPPFAIPSCIKPEHRKFLPMFAAGGPSTSWEAPKMESVEVIKLPQEHDIVYIPKKVEKKKSLGPGPAHTETCLD